jgi:hypothetical protein
MPHRRPLRLLTGGLALAGAALLALAPALPAQASLGSVPVAVSDYVASGQMQARLSQVYGPGATKGSGVDFDASTKAGPISRVYDWTDDRYAHADSDHPIQLTNYWTVPITIADKPVGVAAVWINPTSDQPELAEFTKSAPLAIALAAVPADAALVHDGPTAAWYGVEKDTAIPLVEGRSGVTEPTAVADLALARATPAPEPGTDAGTGIGLAVAVLVLLVLVIVGTVLLPRFLQPKPKPRAKPVRPTADVVEPDRQPEPEPEQPEAEPEPVPEPAPAPAPKRAPTPRTTTKPRTTPPRSTPATPRTPVTQKPAASKPTGTKPAASRAAATKPPASKPPASKPPTPRPRPKKPPQDETPEA